ncbi:MAG: hypothetical protein RIE84_11330 [Parvibaculum sp.]|uniref:hypothetical protein n=1 Tax=Parvibaculum sp. TaxID=2024848 RepID=UPI0032EF9A2D
MSVKKGTKTTFWGTGKSWLAGFGVFLVLIGGSAIYQGVFGSGFVFLALGILAIFGASKMANHHQVTWKG